MILLIDKPPIFTVIMIGMAKYTFYLFVCFSGFIAGCMGNKTAKNSDSSTVPHLTKSRVQNFLKSNSNQEILTQEVIHGCVTVPAESTWQNMWVGFKFTGEVCSATVGPNNTVSVSFLSDNFISVKSTSTQEYKTDTLVGEINNNQVLIVQYLHDGRVISITQTVYNQNNQVVYGQVEGNYIKECIFNREPDRRTNINRSCP